MTITLHPTPTTNPCPEWCTQPAGHGYDAPALARDVLCREHTTDAGDPTSAAVCGFGYQSDGGGETVEMDGITVWVRGNAAQGEISAAEARELAASLLTAADKFDAITADGAA